MSVGAIVGILILLAGSIFLFYRRQRHDTKVAYRNAGQARLENSEVQEASLMRDMGRQSQASLGYGGDRAARGTSNAPDIRRSRSALDVTTASTSRPHPISKAGSSDFSRRDLPRPPPGAALPQHSRAQSPEPLDGLSYAQLQQTGMFSADQLHFIKGLFATNASQASIGNVIGSMISNSQPGSSNSRRSASGSATNATRQITSRQPSAVAAPQDERDYSPPSYETKH